MTLKCRGFFVISFTQAKMASEGLVMIFLEVFVRQRTVFGPKADSANGYIVWNLNLLLSKLT